MFKSLNLDTFSKINQNFSRIANKKMLNSNS